MSPFLTKILIMSTNMYWVLTLRQELHVHYLFNSYSFPMRKALSLFPFHRQRYGAFQKVRTLAKGIKLMLEPGFKPTQSLILESDFTPRHCGWGLSGTLSDVYLGRCLKDNISNVITGYLYFVTVTLVI